VQGIVEADLTTVERLRRLRLLADASLVERRGKIRDIVPAWREGAETIALMICPVWGGEDMAELVVPPAAAEAASAWQRWDRVEWRLRPSMHHLGRIDFSVEFDRLADVVRTPNPGVEPPPPPGQPGSPAAFETWLGKFARAAYYNDVRTAAQQWGFAAKKTWLYPATITDVSGRVLGKLNADAYIDAILTTSRPGFRPDFGVQVIHNGERTVRRWGFDPKGTFEFYVADPQLAALLEPGTKVEVAIELDPDGALSGMRGPFPARIVVRRLRK
jgi:hypothetical protein